VPAALVGGALAALSSPLNNAALAASTVIQQIRWVFSGSRMGQLGRRSIRLSVRWIAACCGGMPMAAASKAQQPAESPPSFALELTHVLRDTDLANGLKVIALANHSVPLATVMVVFRTGAFTQEHGQEGVPHLFEHMLYKAYSGPMNRTWMQQMGTLDIAGYNGMTGDEDVRYFITLPSDKVEDGMRALAELVRDPDFKQDDLNEERRVVFDEFNRDNSEPVRQLHDEVGQRLWTTAWGRKNPLGDPSAINAATPTELKTIFQHYYVPNNAAVIVSGDVSARQAFKWADDRFGHWKKQADPFAGGGLRVALPPLTRSAAIIDERDVSDILLLVEWQGPSVGEDPNGTYAADVLSSILDAPASRFQQRLVDNGLFTSCGISYLTRNNVGPITLTAHTSLDNLPQALTALSSALADLGTDSAFADDELLASKASRRLDRALLLEHRTPAAHEIAEFWAAAGFGYFVDYADRLGAVTREQIKTYANRYIVHAPMAVGVLVPKQSAERVRPAITTFVTRP